MPRGINVVIPAHLLSIAAIGFFFFFFSSLFKKTLFCVFFSRRISLFKKSFVLFYARKSDKIEIREFVARAGPQARGAVLLYFN